MGEVVTCWICLGEGYFNDLPCWCCGGSGEYEVPDDDDDD